MNTFLPYASYSLSSFALDNRRLGNQIKECMQIVNQDFPHHPCTKMWVGYEWELCYYGIVCYYEWQMRLKRGERGGKIKHKSGEKLYNIWHRFDSSTGRPWWFGDNRIHSSHRSCLLAKNYKWYSRLGWTESPTPPDENGKWPYFWPRRQNAKANSG